MRTVLILLSLLAGALQPLQAAVNSQFAQRGATVLWGAAISAAISSLVLIGAALFVWRSPPPSPRLLASLPPVLWTGGVLGALLLGMLTFIAPRLGAAMMFACFLAGLTVCSLALDQFGVLGLPQQPITLGRAVGAGLIVVAVVLVRFF